MDRVLAVRAGVSVWYTRRGCQRAEALCQPRRKVMGIDCKVGVVSLCGVYTIFSILLPLIVNLDFRSVLSSANCDRFGKCYSLHPKL